MDFTDYSYNNGRTVAQEKEVSSDLKEVIDELDIKYGTSGDFGRYFREELKQRGWDHKGKVIPELSIRYEFRKENLGVETQFSNVARFYSDIFKLQLSFDRGLIDGGVLILPTKQHANQIGSNLANFERAKEELVESKPLYSVPVWLVGVKMPI